MMSCGKIFKCIFFLILLNIFLCQNLYAQGLAGPHQANSEMMSASIKTFQKVSFNSDIEEDLNSGKRFYFFRNIKGLYYWIEGGSVIEDFSYGTNIPNTNVKNKILGKMTEDYSGNAQVFGIAICAIGKTEQGVYIGVDCEDVQFFSWNPSGFGTRESPLLVKTGESLSVKLEVEQNSGRWYTYFLVLDSSVNSSIKDFVNIKQEKYNWHTDSGKEGWDYDGRATLEIKTQTESGNTLPLENIFEIEVTAFQDFSDYTPIDYKYLKKKSIYFKFVNDIPGVGEVVTPAIPEKTDVAPVDDSIPGDAPVPDALSQLSAKTVPTLIGNIISGAMGIIGSIALVMFIYGGVTWMTAMGNSEKTKKGMQIIFWSAMGIVIIFSSWIMVNFLLEGFK